MQRTEEAPQISESAEHGLQPLLQRGSKVNAAKVRFIICSILALLLVGCAAQQGVKHSYPGLGNGFSIAEPTIKKDSRNRLQGSGATQSAGLTVYTMEG
jgi:hypothetical protein